MPLSGCELMCTHKQDNDFSIKVKRLIKLEVDSNGLSGKVLFIVNLDWHRVQKLSFRPLYSLEK